MDFAEASIDSSFNHWKARGVKDKEKAMIDIFTGKMGELGVYQLLCKKGYFATKPDFEIYLGRRKSFDADITSGELKFHCKAQNIESMLKYGESWILQYGGEGKGHTDKLFKHQSPKDYLVPTMVEGNSVTIYGIVKISILFEKDMIRLPKVVWFHKTKRAIYWDDLKTLSHYNRWGLIL